MENKYRYIIFIFLVLVSASIDSFTNFGIGKYLDLLLLIFIFIVFIRDTYMESEKNNETSKLEKCKWYIVLILLLFNMINIEEFEQFRIKKYLNLILSISFIIVFIRGIFLEWKVNAKRNKNLKEKGTNEKKELEILSTYTNYIWIYVKFLDTVLWTFF